MRTARSTVRLGGWAVLLMAAGQAIGVSPARADDAKPAGAKSGAKADPVAVGSETFHREWIPDDPRGHGGDGLGPSYNDTSCVACHNSGGSGGAGPVGKNIDILSASRDPFNNRNFTVQQSGAPAAGGQPAAPRPNLDPLIDVHAGFKTSRTVVLHKFGTDPNYDAWREAALRPRNAPRVLVSDGGVTQIIDMASPVEETPTEFAAVVPDVMPPPALPAAMQNPFAAMRPGPTAQRPRPLSPQSLVDARASNRLNQVRMAMFQGNPAAGPSLAVGEFVVARSQRNPTPLFGLGLIDAIPESAIVAISARESKESPQTAGRVSRLKDGRIGRLGWKGQTANVEDFVLNACAVEVGLEVPDHHQSISPLAPKYKTTGLDLTADECTALVAYVRDLPRPAERPIVEAEGSIVLASGKEAFARVGCTSCHAPKLGEVAGLYSDLLLHDMGQEMAESGSYNGGGSGDDDDEPLVPPAAVGIAAGTPAPRTAPALRGANRQEWRTPPLWGFRDSAPYLHDGRAQTLEQAVAMHGGQGSAAAQAFFALSPRERLALEGFLKSLVAPGPRPQLARAEGHPEAGE